MFRFLRLACGMAHETGMQRILEEQTFDASQVIWLCALLV